MLSQNLTTEEKQNSLRVFATRPVLTTVCLLFLSEVPLYNSMFLLSKLGLPRLFTIHLLDMEETSGARFEPEVLTSSSRAPPYKRCDAH
ncbi:hypothetical protein TNCT_378621 [Trichonephila clavata]|uniref:Uncharacterized protein n=1 Tax=Trichonephila clavata TaxID=2740835 RepID=A0A8X6FA81_TRICU|nr:hypothetical protein TNCT_378621 [Trichonephila clavata]